MSVNDQVRELIAKYPDVKLGMHRAYRDGEYLFMLVNPRDNMRGVWASVDDLMAGRTEQLMLDLTEACDTLTRLMKETDE